jgi:hypothetical protein
MIRVAVIGVGYIAKSVHLPTLLASDCTIAGVMSKTGATASTGQDRERREAPGSHRPAPESPFFPSTPFKNCELEHDLPGVAPEVAGRGCPTGSSTSQVGTADQAPGSRGVILVPGASPAPRLGLARHRRRSER